MTLTIEHVLTIEAMECGECGVPFGLTLSFIAERRKDHRTWYCPNGHLRHYPAENDLEKANRLLATARERARWAESSAQAARDQARAAERSRAAMKGHLTRARNKIAAGNCPVPDCGQHFANVREHMKFKHPEFHLTDPETGEAAVL